MKIAFDIDGTLKKQYGGKVRWLHRELEKFSEQGHDIIVWSGGGQEYANNYVKANDLPARTAVKCSEVVDIAFDDATDNLDNAKLTIQVDSE